MSSEIVPVADADQGAAGSPRRREPRWAAFLMVLFMLGIVAGPVVVLEGPREVARWRAAAALESQLNGDLPGAIDQLTRLIESRPRQADLYFNRAQLYEQQGSLEAALNDYDRVLELTPGSSQVWQARAMLLYQTGRPREAVESAAEGLRLTTKIAERVVALNTLAYVRALTRGDLAQASEEIQEALAVHSQSAAMLDTRGYIRFLRGELKGAKSDLDKSVELAEAELKAHEERLAGERLGVIDVRLDRLTLKEHQKTVAVIRYHRALLHDAMEDDDGAEADRRRVRELGFEPGEHLF